MPSSTCFRALIAMSRVMVSRVTWSGMTTSSGYAGSSPLSRVGPIMKTCAGYVWGVGRALPLLLPSSEPCSEPKMDATWWVPQSLPRLLPWSSAISAADARSDVAVVDAGAIGLLTIL